MTVTKSTSTSTVDILTKSNGVIRVTTVDGKVTLSIAGPPAEIDGDYISGGIAEIDLDPSAIAELIAALTKPHVMVSYIDPPP
jgi:hypothetical protein